MWLKRSGTMTRGGVLLAVALTLLVGVAVASTEDRVVIAVANHAAR